jgi:hypothetical protein
MSCSTLKRGSSQVEGKYTRFCILRFLNCSYVRILSLPPLSSVGHRQLDMQKVDSIWKRELQSLIRSADPKRNGLLQETYKCEFIFHSFLFFPASIVYSLLQFIAFPFYAAALGEEKKVIFFSILSSEFVEDESAAGAAGAASNSVTVCIIHSWQ